MQSGRILPATDGPGQWRFLLRVARMKRSEIRDGQARIPLRSMRATKTKHAASFSRGLSPPRFACSLATNEGSGAPIGAVGCLRGTLVRANDVDPQGATARPHVPSRGTSASRRSTAAFCAPDCLPLVDGHHSRALLAGLSPARPTASNLRVASRSGGGQSPEAPGAWLRATRAGAASRSALARLRRRPRERDGTTVPEKYVRSSRTCVRLFIA
jgi:hypothetical protein